MHVSIQVGRTTASLLLKDILQKHHTESISILINRHQSITLYREKLKSAERTQASKQHKQKWAYFLLDKIMSVLHVTLLDCSSLTHHFKLTTVTTKQHTWSPQTSLKVTPTTFARFWLAVIHLGRCNIQSMSEEEIAVKASQVHEENWMQAS